MFHAVCCAVLLSQTPQARGAEHRPRCGPEPEQFDVEVAAPHLPTDPSSALSRAALPSDPRAVLLSPSTSHAGLLAELFLAGLHSLSQRLQAPGSED